MPISEQVIGIRGWKGVHLRDAASTYAIQFSVLIGFRSPVSLSVNAQIRQHFSHIPPRKDSSERQSSGNDQWLASLSEIERDQSQFARKLFNLAISLLLRSNNLSIVNHIKMQCYSLQLLRVSVSSLAALT